MGVRGEEVGEPVADAGARVLVRMSVRDAGARVLVRISVMAVGAPVLVRMPVTVVVMAHVMPLPMRAAVDVTSPRDHYVRMSARMHLSPAHDAHPRTPGEEQFALAAEILALLGDRTRLILLHALTRSEADVTTLTEAVGAARPAVSQHLARLRLAGLVNTRKEGRRVIYSLRDGHLRRLLDEALNVADHRLDDRPVHD
ncbi:DNA-binding transcriptional ArsR family regulator [Streptomyces sp. BK205]|nr:DNA-binding transcriptional ArsR family regulator [Streptomyces sp. BK205]